MPKPVRLSPTTLARWYACGCPAAWKFAEQYEAKADNIHFRMGNIVHSLLEGSLQENEVRHEDQAAVTMFKRIVELKSGLGLTVFFDSHKQPIVEKKLEWNLSPSLRFVIKIDFMGIDGTGTPVIVDWKSTLGKGWKSINGDIFPQAMAFQSPAYLLGPPKRLWSKWGLPLAKWPKKLYYVVGPLRGPAQVFTYEWNANDDLNLRQALALATRAISDQTFPKVYGRHCHECDMQGPCFEFEGWQAHYKRRGEKENEPSPLDPTD